MKKILILLISLLFSFNLFADMDIVDYAVTDHIIEKNLEKSKKEHHHEFKYSDNRYINTKLIKGEKLIKYHINENGKHYSYENIIWNKYYLVKSFDYIEECIYCHEKYITTRTKIIREATKKDLDLFKNNKKWYQTYNYDKNKYEISEWLIIVLITLGVISIFVIGAIINYFCD